MAQLRGERSENEKMYNRCVCILDCMCVRVRRYVTLRGFYYSLTGRKFLAYTIQAFMSVVAFADTHD